MRRCWNQHCRRLSRTNCGATFCNQQQDSGQIGLLLVRGLTFCLWASSRKWACLWERHAPSPLVTHGSSWGACKFVARLHYSCRLGTNGLSEVPSELCCLSSSGYASCLLPSTLHTSTSHLLPSTFYNRLSKVYLDAATSYLLPFTFYLRPLP